jgi:hypothetical protein
MHLPAGVGMAMLSYAVVCFYGPHKAFCSSVQHACSVLPSSPACFLLLSVFSTLCTVYPSVYFCSSSFPYLSHGTVLPSGVRGSVVG